MNATQLQIENIAQREAFVALLEAVMSATNQIDLNTAFENDIPPQWWIELRRVQVAVRDALAVAKNA